MGDLELFERFGLAMAIGLLVGVERHWRERNAPSGQRMAGVRTFTLIGLFGGAAGLVDLALAQRFPLHATPGLATGLFALPFAGGFAWFAMREAKADGSLSATSFVAGLGVYALAALAILGEMRVAAAGGVAMAAILASREALHGFLRRLGWAELRAAIVLLGMSVIILPLLPESPIGPYGGVSARRVWLIAILLASLSYAGYIATRLAGPTHGELISGLMAGLVSSTGATLAFARRARDGESPRLLASGAAVAGAVSLARTAALIGALAPGLAPHAAPPLLAATLAMALSALLLAKRAPLATGHPQQANPFELANIAQVVALLVIAGLVARAALAHFGSGGLVVASFLAGLADVDAATVTISDLARQGASPGTLAPALAAAVLANLGFKVAGGLALGGAGFGLRLGAATGAALLSALAIHLLA